MELVFENRSSKSGVVIEDLCNKIVKYKEFEHLRSFYDKIVVLYHDDQISFREAQEIQRSFVGISTKPIVGKDTSASSVSDVRVGCIRLNLPLISYEGPRDIDDERFTEFLLEHEFCHLLLNEGKRVYASTALSELIRRYEAIPKRRMFGLETLNALRQDRLHLIVDGMVIKRYHYAYLRQKEEALARYDWNIEYYPRTTHMNGLDYSLTSALVDGIQCVRVCLNLSEIDSNRLTEQEEKTKGSILKMYEDSFKLRQDLIQRTSDIPDLLTLFTPEVLKDENRYFEKITYLWDKLNLLSPMHVPKTLSLEHCGICSRPTRSHQLRYGGYVCHGCWVRFFRRLNSSTKEEGVNRETVRCFSSQKH